MHKYIYISIIFSLFGCIAIRQDRDIMNKSENYVRKKYKKFNYEGEFDLSKQSFKKLYSYQRGILKYIDLEKDTVVLVKEIVKHISSRKKIIIWMVKDSSDVWIVKDNIVYNPKKIHF